MVFFILLLFLKMWENERGADTNMPGTGGLILKEIVELEKITNLEIKRGARAPWAPPPPLDTTLS